MENLLGLMNFIVIKIVVLPKLNQGVHTAISTMKNDYQFKDEMTLYYERVLQGIDVWNNLFEFAPKDPEKMMMYMKLFERVKLVSVEWEGVLFKVSKITQD